MATFKTYKTKNGKKKYKFKVYLGLDPVTGKRIETTRQGFDTKKEAQLALNGLLIDYHNNGWNNHKITTVNDLYNSWIKVYQGKAKINTVNIRKNDYRRLYKKQIGNIDITKINVAFCQKIVNELANKYRNYQVKLAPLSLMFDYAVNLELIPDNPLHKVILPKTKIESKRIKNNFYSKSELKEFLKDVKEYSEIYSPYVYPLFRLLAFSGMRVSEALALTWNDLNLMTGKVKISKSIFYNSNTKKIEVGLPKTKAGNRELYLDKTTLSILREWQNNERRLLFKLGRQNSHNLIFTTTLTPQPEYLGANNIRSTLQVIYKHYPKLKKITIHGLRHTHASLLFEAGATIKEVQERLGHKDVKTTLNIYTHVTQNAKKDTPLKFEKYMDF